jgi:O-antigen ligase
MKINHIFTSGIFVILFLPFLNFLPYFAPPDWGKTIIFRSILAIFLFLISYYFLNKPTYKEKTGNQFFSPLNLKKNHIAWALLTLLGFFLLATLFSVDPHFSFFGDPIRAGGVLNFAFYIIFCLFLFSYVKEQDWQRYFDFSIVIGILVSLVAIFQSLGWFRNLLSYVPSRPPSTIGNPIFLGVYLVILFFLLLPKIIQAIKTKETSYLVFYSSSLLLFLYVILLTGSRAAWLALIAGCFWFVIFYPQKILKTKLLAGAILLVAVAFVYYANTTTHFPDFLAHNKLFNAIQPRLSFKLFLDDERFPAWSIGWQAFLEKPLFGWGPENYAVGFNKYYNPSTVGYSWWDKAHNVFLEIANTAGLTTLLSYLVLIGILIWQLSKKSFDKNPGDRLQKHGLITTIIAYLIANFFSIDSFSSYLLFFMIIAYTMFLIKKESSETAPQSTVQPIIKQALKHKKLTLGALFILMLWFIWFYNIVPLGVNAEINRTQTLVTFKKCDQAFAKMDENLKTHSFLNTYVRLKYIDFVGQCSDLYSDKSAIYAQKGIAVEKELTVSNPLYVRSWLYLAQFTTIVANSQQDPQIKKELFAKSYQALDKASSLSPRNMDILLEKWRTDLLSQDYKKMIERGDTCVKEYPQVGTCYWIRGLGNIRMKKFDEAKKDIETAEHYKFDYVNEISLAQLINAYLDVENYQELVPAYEKLIKIDPSVPENHISLAVIYTKLNNWKKAREEADIVLTLRPDLKPEVDKFLKTFPK